MHQRHQRPLQPQQKTLQGAHKDHNYKANAVGGTFVKVGYIKTSAEIISEAKTVLAGGAGSVVPGGARLVSTRRPITPREPRRQLYGKHQAPPGRPPSAFSLRYLQFESRALPSLDPIKQQQRRQQEFERKVLLHDDIPVQRSGSIGTLLDYVDGLNNNTNITSDGGNCGTVEARNIIINNNQVLGKLPALLSPPKITASLENLSEEMPPRHPDLIRRNGSLDALGRVDCGSTKRGDDKTDVNRFNANHKVCDGVEIKFPVHQHGSSLFTEGAKKHHNLFIRKKTKSVDIPPTVTGVGEETANEGIPSHLRDKSKGGRSTSSLNRKNGSENLRGNTTGANGSSDTAAAAVAGRSIFMLSKTRLNRSNDLLAQSTTETLLDLLKAHAGIKECTEETVLHINTILIELYTRVKGAKGNWRGAILSGLYGLVECSSAKILLGVARVVLALCVTGSNLTGACKLVFKVARNEINDHLFAETDVPELLIEGLGRASPLDEPEACIYGYGSVRFLASASSANARSCSISSPRKPGNISGNQCAATSKQKSIAQRLARHGAVPLMVLHLQILNEAGAVVKLTGSPMHALYQLSAALRALAGVPQALTNHNKPLVVNSQQTELGLVIRETREFQDIKLELACPHLVRAAEISIGESELQANIARTLSVLSENDACCEALSEFSARIGMMLGPCSVLIKKSPEKPLTLLSRLGYILGNIMAKHDSARVLFYNNDVAMEYLLDDLRLYSCQKFVIQNQMGDSVIDVLIKLIRVLANMSVNHDVGHDLGSKAALGDILLRMLLTANKVKGEKMSSEMEELLQAILGALHNLSFYQSEMDDHDSSRKLENTGSVCSRIIDFSVALCATLKSGPEMVRYETARVLGNMTRNKKARDAFCSAGGMRVITQCLGSEDYELAATSSGVLVNLLGDWERRAPFRELKGPLILRDVLQKSAMQNDWILAGIVCQALWNYLIDSGNVIGALGEDEADYIVGDLAEYLDEVGIFGNNAPDVLWEQFASVAADLLERIQSSMSIGNSPCCSSEEDSDEVVSGKIGNKWAGNFKNWLRE